MPQAPRVSRLPRRHAPLRRRLQTLVLSNQLAPLHLTHQINLNRLPLFPAPSLRLSTFTLHPSLFIPPLLSILIPAYNAAPWIDTTLRSALAQTWPNTELIVVDDGSTDTTLALANAFASAHSAASIRVVTQPNRGASAARNHALRLARGDYIQFLDADDWIAPDKITIQLDRLIPLGPRALASASWVRVDREFLHNGEPSTRSSITFPQPPPPNARDLTGIEFLQLNFETISMMHPAAWLAPRALLDAAGPWDESLSLNDDGEYFARVALASTGIVFCPDARSFYRSNLSGSLSRRKDPRALASLHRSVELTLSHLLAADSSPRSTAAAAFAWKWAAFELYPSSPDLSRDAERRSLALGGSPRPFPASGRFQLLSQLLGWRLARRLTA
ncbi:glycosyltransferase family 2 protein [Nibricoccus aquaticus]|uniref:glycosyltransferase family 2 protein n=1 Tax=Nibricoccus aquaticus TaxID=2576891 RepID=UPI001FE6EDF4|nr:glycosyltransferase family A protein [Nibricoccus aquaticus]